MLHVLAYPFITAAAFYLGSRAKITEALWSRYPKPFARFMDCAACAGFWYGLILQAIVGIGPQHLDFLGFTWQDPATPFIVGLCSLVWTPIIAAVMQSALDHLGSAVPADDEEEDPRG